MSQYANKKRQAIFERDKGICQYCKKYVEDEGTLDHVYPKSKGGVNAQWNLVWACYPCNHEKTNNLPATSLFAMAMFRAMLTNLDIALSREIYDKKMIGYAHDTPYQKGLKSARITVKKILGQKLGIDLAKHVEIGRAHV